MGIEIVNLDGGLGNCITVSGFVTAQEYVEIHREHLAQNEKTFSEYKYSICDWSAVEDFDFTSENMRHVALLCENAAAKNTQAIVALVGPKDVLFGIGRMFEMMAHNTGWEIRVFRSRKEAEAWIVRRVMDKFKIAHITFAP